jgi:hypothetical protein
MGGMSRRTGVRHHHARRDPDGLQRVCISITMHGAVIDRLSYLADRERVSRSMVAETLLRRAFALFEAER